MYYVINKKAKDCYLLAGKSNGAKRKIKKIVSFIKKG